MKKARVYKTLDGLKKAIETIGNVQKDFTYNRNLYGEISKRDVKILEYFNIHIQCKKAVWSRRARGFCSICGYRVEPQIAELIQANREMLDNLARYIKF